MYTRPIPLTPGVGADALRSLSLYTLRGAPSAGAPKRVQTAYSHLVDHFTGMVLDPSSSIERFEHHVVLVQRTPTADRKQRGAWSRLRPPSRTHSVTPAVAATGVNAKEFDGVFEFQSTCWPGRLVTIARGRLGAADRTLTSLMFSHMRFLGSNPKRHVVGAVSVRVAGRPPGSMQRSRCRPCSRPSPRPGLRHRALADPRTTSRPLQSWAAGRAVRPDAGGALPDSASRPPVPSSPGGRPPPRQVEGLDDSAECRRHTVQAQSETQGIMATLGLGPIESEQALSLVQGLAGAGRKAAHTVGLCPPLLLQSATHTVAAVATTRQRVFQCLVSACKPVPAPAPVASAGAHQRSGSTEQTGAPPAKRARSAGGGGAQQQVPGQSQYQRQQQRGGQAAGGRHYALGESAATVGAPAVPPSVGGGAAAAAFHRGGSVLSAPALQAVPMVPATSSAPSVEVTEEVERAAVAVIKAERAGAEQHGVAQAYQNLTAVLQRNGVFNFGIGGKLLLDVVSHVKESLSTRGGV